MGALKGHGLPDPLPKMDEAADLYRVAYEAGQKSLSDQSAELSGMRTRAVSYMAFIGTATAFLVTNTLRLATPGWYFYSMAIAATVCVSWATIELCLLIRPKLKFSFNFDPREIISTFIDRQVPRPSEAQLLRSLTGWTAVNIESNELILDKVRARFARVIMFGGGGLLLWTTAIWIFGSVGVRG